jgi:hypothetical protein
MAKILEQIAKSESCDEADSERNRWSIRHVESKEFCCSSESQP